MTSYTSETPQAPDPDSLGVPQPIQVGQPQPIEPAPEYVEPGGRHAEPEQPAAPSPAEDEDDDSEAAEDDDSEADSKA